MKLSNFEISNLRLEIEADGNEFSRSKSFGSPGVSKEIVRSPSGWAVDTHLRELKRER